MSAREEIQPTSPADFTAAGAVSPADSRLQTRAALHRRPVRDHTKPTNSPALYQQVYCSIKVGAMHATVISHRDLALKLAIKHMGKYTSSRR